MMPPRVLASGSKPCGGNYFERKAKRSLLLDDMPFQFCLGTTEAPIHLGTTKPDIDDYKRPDKNHLNHGNKETSSGSR